MSRHKTAEPHSDDYGARAVRCRHWRWMPGMLAEYPFSHEAEIQTFRVCCDDPPDMGSALPGFYDPATLGCLQRLVEDVFYPDAIATLHSRLLDPLRRETEKCQRVWWVSLSTGRAFDGCECAAEALIVALEEVDG